MYRDSEENPLAFLGGNKHISDLILKQNWEATELGHPANWPLRLKYAISSQLANPCPSFVCWGKSKILLYNAAFASLFPNEDLIQGEEKLGQIAFGVHWERVDKAIAEAYANKGSIVKGVRVGDQGRLGQRYLDISMGTLFELDGEIFGAWGLCQEKTFEIAAGDILRTSQQYLRSLIGSAPMGICVVGRNPLQVEEVNDEFLRLLGIPQRGPEVMEVISELLGDISDFAVQDQPHYLKEVERPQLINGLKRTGYIDVMVSPYRTRTGASGGFTLMVVDVTDRVEVRQELYQVNEDLRAANEELAASNEELAASNEELQIINDDLDFSQRELAKSLEQLEETEGQIRQMVAATPFPMALYVGEEMRIVQANPSIIQVWGKGANVIGKTYSEVLPELENQMVYEQLASVYHTGTPFHARNQRIDLEIDGGLKVFYFNYSLTPIYDKLGNIFGVMNTAADITDIMVAKERVERVQKNFRNTIMQAQVAVCLLEGPQHHVTLANAAMLQIWGRDAKAVLGHPVFEALPDVRFQGLEEAMLEVYETGEPFNAYEQPISLLRNGKPDLLYLNFVYQPYRDDSGEILGILAISVDVTETVKSRQEVEKAYTRLNLVVEAANLGMFDFEVDTGKLACDERCRNFFGMPIIGDLDYKDFLKGLHLSDVAPTMHAIEKAMEVKNGGVFTHECRVMKPNSEQEIWLRAVGKVYFDLENKPTRFMGVMLDISQNKIAELEAKEAAARKSRLASIVESSNDVIISKDLNGIITSWNPAAEQMFGFTPQEAIGKHITLIIPLDRRNEEEIIISSVKAGRKVDHFDTLRQAKDGSYRQLSLTVSPITDGSGKVIGASKIARDISNQVVAQQAIARYTERVEAINLVINAIAMEVDTNHILQRVAQLTIHLLDAELGIFVPVADRAEMLVRYVAPVTALAPQSVDAVVSFFEQLLEEREEVTTNRWANLADAQLNYHASGVTKPILSLLAIPIVTSKDELLGRMYFAHPAKDYFNQDHEEMLFAIAGHLSIGIDKALLYETVLELNRKKDEFISVASHELKTPLSGINGYIQILERVIKDEQPGKYLAKAAHQVKKLSSLVNDLLDVSKIEAGKLKFSVTEVDLGATIEGTVDMVAEISGDYQIDFLQAGQKCIVIADEQRIEQVLTNLLSNAIKYSPGANRVEVLLKVEEGRALVGVKDFGIGIPSEKMTRLFSRFYRIDEQTPNISGLGIGLYLCREIVERLQGKIWVESEKGVGSTFWFSLPIATN